MVVDNWLNVYLSRGLRCAIFGGGWSGHVLRLWGSDYRGCAENCLIATRGNKPLRMGLGPFKAKDFLSTETEYCLYISAIKFVPIAPAVICANPIIAQDPTFRYKHCLSRSHIMHFDPFNFKRHYGLAISSRSSNTTIRMTWSYTFATTSPCMSFIMTSHTAGVKWWSFSSGSNAAKPSTLPK